MKNLIASVTLACLTSGCPHLPATAAFAQAKSDGVVGLGTWTLTETNGVHPTPGLGRFGATTPAGPVLATRPHPHTPPPAVPVSPGSGRNTR
jgi:hypothetical protein